MCECKFEQLKDSDDILYATLPDDNVLQLQRVDGKWRACLQTVDIWVVDLIDKGITNLTHAKRTAIREAIAYHYKTIEALEGLLAQRISRTKKDV